LSTATLLVYFRAVVLERSGRAIAARLCVGPGGSTAPQRLLGPPWVRSAPPDDRGFLRVTREETIMAAKKKAVRRTVLRSSKGKKLYAVRNPDGTFKNIQDYARASRADQAKKSKKEKAK
jgi:hypothetical protein